MEKFKIRKNSIAECYTAEKDQIINNGLHNTDNIHVKKGDWICNDPLNKNDIWPIHKSLHKNYTIIKGDRDYKKWNK